MTHPTPVKPETSGDAPDFYDTAHKLHNLSLTVEENRAALQSAYQQGVEAGRKWRKIDDGLPYDEIVLCYREVGNIIQSWWYDCSLDEFISRHKFTHWQPITPPEQSQ